MKVKIPRVKSTPTAKDYAYAVHEAGHAVALFNHGIKFKSVSLKKMITKKFITKNSGVIDTWITGIIGSEYHNFREVPVERCLDSAICALAGGCAEYRHSTRTGDEVFQDSDNDTSQAHYLCEKAGVPFKLALYGAIDIVEKYEPHIKGVANALLKSQELSYNEVEKIIKTIPAKIQDPK